MTSQQATKSTDAMLAFQAVGNVAILQHVIMPLLEKDSLSMYHLDPSVIIQSPISNDTLIRLITYSTGLNFLLLLSNNLVLQSQHSNIISTGASVISGSIFIYALFIICGFHPAYFPVQTLLTSAYVAMNTICCTSLPQEDSNSIKENQGSDSLIATQMRIWIYLCGPSQSNLQNLHQSTFYGSLVGMGSTSILRILDHGMQIQRHPVPLLLGFVWGRAGGFMVSVLFRLIRQRLS